MKRATPFPLFKARLQLKTLEIKFKKKLTFKHHEPILIAVHCGPPTDQATRLLLATSNKSAIFKQFAACFGPFEHGRRFQLRLTFRSLSLSLSLKANRTKNTHSADGQTDGAGLFRFAKLVQPFDVQKAEVN